MKKSPPRSEQLELPFPDLPSALETISGKSGIKAWYYILNPRKQEMLALDDLGNYVWIPHDTARLTPHLFGGKTLARQTARNFKFSIIKRYLWPVGDTRSSNDGLP